MTDTVIPYLNVSDGWAAAARGISVRNRTAAVRNHERTVGKSLNRSEVRHCMKAVVSALR